MRRVLLVVLFIVGLYIDIYYPTLDAIVLLVELIIIFILINRIDMRKYKEIYNKMDPNEQRLVHKLLGLLLACILLPICNLIYNLYQILYL